LIRSIVTTLRWGGGVLGVFEIYVGEYEVRASRDQVYVHIPRKLADQLGTRRVVIDATINAELCEDKSLHGRRMIFPATLTPVGQTYRLKIPSRYRELARYKDCVKLRISLAPRLS
jgi:hypothetical protein